jgi:type IV pilus assembly protein PilX
MKTTIPSRPLRGPAAQRGAALVVGLILLMVLTLLAISGMNTATVELQMAGNMQYSQNAFQAAETGIELTMASGSHNTSATPTMPRTVVYGPDAYETVTRFQVPNGTTPVPSGGFSMGSGTGFSAYHFDISSTGTSARGARAVNTQSFYVVGPSGS